MKKTIIIVSLLVASMGTRAQQVPQQKEEQPIYVKMLPSQLAGLQQLLVFSFEWLPKSAAPSNAVEQAKSAIQTLYPVLAADSTIVKKPVVKPVVKK